MIDVLMAAVIAMAHPQAPADTTVVTVEEDDPALTAGRWGTCVAARALCCPMARSRSPAMTPTRTAGPVRSTARLPALRLTAR